VIAPSAISASIDWLGKMPDEICSLIGATVRDSLPNGKSSGAAKAKIMASAKTPP
jgi:hypothetical protein